MPSYNLHFIRRCLKYVIQLCNNYRKYGIRVNTISAGPLASRAAKAIGGAGKAKTFIDYGTTSYATLLLFLFNKRYFYFKIVFSHRLYYCQRPRVSRLEL
jgi:hypothetical protein